MRVGVVGEVKPSERRVALTPAGTRMLTHRGHEVLVQLGAGSGSGFFDPEYAAAGATLTPNASDV
jgi:alanine dehydrogenase